MRLFVAIGLTDEARQAIAAWTQELRGAFLRMRWSSPEQWHVTLQFLGETNEAECSCVARRLKDLHAQSVDVE